MDPSALSTLYERLLPVYVLGPDLQTEKLRFQSHVRGTPLMAGQPHRWDKRNVTGLRPRGPQWESRKSDSPLCALPVVCNRDPIRTHSSKLHI